jgi:N-acylneuraminate cytidylyltransferase
VRDNGRTERQSGPALGVIPARGGSKRVPRKNLYPLGGRPLIAHSILAAREAASLDRVIVSTDDQEIAEVARACGAEVPFLRPAEISVDVTPDLPVFQHALGWLAEQEGYRRSS